MRGLGLVGLLVVVAILLVLYAQSIKPVAEVKKKIEPEVQQLAGQDESGRRVSDSYDLEAELSGNKLAGLKVTRLAQESAMRKFYGLEEGDTIVEVGSQGAMLKARDFDDGTMFRDLIAAAYQTKQPLVVKRNGQEITLKPGGAGSAAPSNNPLDQITQPR